MKKKITEMLREILGEEYEQASNTAKVIFYIIAMFGLAFGYLSTLIKIYPVGIIRVKIAAKRVNKRITKLCISNEAGNKIADLVEEKLMELCRKTLRFTIEDVEKIANDAVNEVLYFK